MNQEYICMVCPNSCRIRVRDDGGVLEIEGNACPRGEAFARAEYTHPVRMLTATVVIRGAALPRLPVISSAEIPKEKIADCLKEIYRLSVDAPVACSQVLIPDILGLGVDIIASRSMQQV